MTGNQAYNKVGNQADNKKINKTGDMRNRLKDSATRSVAGSITDNNEQGEQQNGQYDVLMLIELEFPNYYLATKRMDILVLFISLLRSNVPVPQGSSIAPRHLEAISVVTGIC